MGTKRIIWIVNHRTLMPAEVPILMSLGWEVFVPKIIPKSGYYRSGSIDFSYDKDLTIDRSALEILNEHAFYERRWSPTVSEIVNRNFDVLVTSVSPFKTPLIESLHKFHGIIAARVFGRELPYTYADYLNQPDWAGVREAIETVGERFVFCQAFPVLASPEEELLKQRAYTVIASIPDWMWSNRDSWTGNESRALFLCPDIIATSHYKRVYDEFQNELGHLPHWIFGAQSIKIDDPSVLGSVSDAKLFELYRSTKLFIYTSQEPRHLHYSPIEAMIVGAPVLYLHGGLLHHLGGDRQSGLCADFGEMRDKASRLLNGDAELSDNIRHDQKAIVRTFETDLARSQWTELLDRASEIGTTAHEG